MVPEEVVIPTAQPTGKPTIAAHAKTLIQKYHQATTNMTGTRCPTHHNGADRHCHKAKTHTKANSNLAAIHPLMMVARLVLTVVCVFGLMTVLVSSVVMSGTPGPRHACGSLVILDECLCMCCDGGFACRLCSWYDCFLGHHRLAYALTRVYLAV